MRATEAVAPASDAIGVGSWAVLVGVLVGCAVLVAAGPRGRTVAWSGQATGRTGTAAWFRRVSAAATGRFGARRGDLDGPPSMQVIVTQVAGLLRGGLPPGQAWQMVGQVRVDRHGVPDADDLTALVMDTGRVRGADAAATRRQVAAIVAACRLAAEVGAPLAAVLDVIVGTLVGAARAEDDRAAALAGPRSTARVLAWLPGIGAVVGMALGADPLGLFLAGGLGALAPMTGLVLVVVGQRWTASLVARARAAGDPP